MCGIKSKMRQRSVQARKKPRRLLIPNVVRTVLMAYFCSTIVASFTVFPNGQLPTTSITRLGRYRQRAFIIPTVSYRASAVRAQRTGTTAQAGDTSAEPDQAEWKALLAALRMYKAAYGDLKVPQRFVVPSMLPWPKSAWGLKLGKKIGMIRSEGRLVGANEARRKVLDDMGFVWSVRSRETASSGISYDQIYEAITAYKQTYPQESDFVVIPSNFVVPDCDPWPVSTRGLPLGKKLGTMRTAGFLKANPKVRGKLKELGIETSMRAAVNDTRFQRVYDALKRYKEIYGDLLVPQPFSVPEDSEEWPENTRGLRLGARVNAIRSQGTFVNTNPERREMLNEIGFVWSPPPAQRGRKKADQGTAQGGSLSPAEIAASITPTESAMEDLFGPSADFKEVKPFNFDSASALEWGLASSIENADEPQPSPRMPAKREYVPPKSFQESLNEAREMAISVGILETVPEDDNRLRKGMLEKEFPWFNDDFGDDFVFEDVVEAFSIYKDMYGDFSNLSVAYDFVVPAVENAGFGAMESATTFDADASARAAAAIAAYEEQGRRLESEDLIATEIQRLQAEVEGELALVTEMTAEVGGTTEWPEHLSEMQLGHIFRRIRDGSLEVKHLPERKAKLDAIDFDWGDPEYYIDVPFEKAMCAFLAYYLIRGDMFVYDDFVIPDEEPWPTVFAGHALGKVAKRVRELQNYIEAYHPEKVQLLRMVEFVWFPTMALPLPPRVNTTLEFDQLSAYGHPDYAQIHDPPEGLYEGIMRGGPLFNPERGEDVFRMYHNWEYVKDLWYELGCRDRATMLNRTGYATLAAEHQEKYGPGMYKLMDVAFEELKGDGATKSEASRRDYVSKLLFWRDEMLVSIDTTRREIKSRTRVIDAWLDVLLKPSEREDSGYDGEPNNVLRAMFDVAELEEVSPENQTEAVFDYQSLCHDDKPFSDNFLTGNDDCYYEDEEVMLEAIRSRKLVTL